MIKNYIKFISLFSAILLFLPSCMRVPTYKRRSLKTVSDHCTYRREEKNVIIRAKKLNSAEKIYLFNDRSTLFHKDKIQMIYLSIHNLSDTSYIFSPDEINLKQIAHQDVIKLMKKTNSASRLTGSALLSVFPLWTCVMTHVQMNIPATKQAPPIFLGSLFLISIPLIILSTTFFIQGIKSIGMNTRIKKDLKEKIVSEQVVISSGEHYEELILVKSSDYNQRFTITLHEEYETKHIIAFDVDLHQNNGENYTLTK